jgi:hypothetical protein
MSVILSMKCIRSFGARLYHNLAKPQPALFEADKALPPNDQVIQHVNTQELAGGDDVFGDGDVFYTYMENLLDSASERE